MYLSLKCFNIWKIQYKSISLFNNVILTTRFALTGDYIALYQIQRGLMSKRASEKDEYIAQLARDREDLKVCY